MAIERKKLTQTACEKAQPNSKIWDSEVKGFGLFTGKTRKTFYYQRDLHGKTVRIKIGNFPDVSSGIARGEAFQLAADHSTGVAAKRIAASKIPTLCDAMESYLARGKLRSQYNKDTVRQQVNRHLKSWLNTPLDEINRAMCAKAHARISVAKTGIDSLGRKTKLGGRRAANHTLRSFRSIYNHALRTHEMSVCPTIAIEWHDEEPPKTIIDDFDTWQTEVGALVNPVHSVFYRFLLLTGLRRNEALSLRWDQIHDDHLHLPETKNGRAFNLPLVDAHHVIIEPLRIYRSDYVFHGKKQALYLKEPARISWSPHTHRRTFATVAENDAQLDESIVGHLLNHTPTTVTGRRYISVDHQRLREPMAEVVSAFKRRALI